MKLVSPLPHKRGRLEIIPLIDIMFFLLAAFMVVSIGKIHLKSLKVSLPTDVPAAQKEPKEDFIDVSINADGQVQLDKELIPTKDALLARLQDLYAKNKDQKFLITADKDAHHGDVMSILGRLRAAGFQKVAFSIKSERGSTPGSASISGPATAAPVASSTTSAPEPETLPASPATVGAAPAVATPATAATESTAAPAAPTAGSSAAPAPATSPTGN